METISLTQREVTMLEQTIAVPIESFKNEDFRKKLGDDYAEAESLYKKIEEHSNNKIILDLPKNNIALLLKSFIFARDICDPIEFHTLTGFNWDESDNLIVKLLDFMKM